MKTVETPPLICQFDRSKTIEWTVEKILLQADILGLRDSVAFRLTEAWLSIRFPQQTIKTEAQYITSIEGKPIIVFKFNRTMFFVSSVFDTFVLSKCHTCVEQGFKAYLLVSSDAVQDMRLIGGPENVTDRITVLTVEYFVGFGIDILSEFDSKKASKTFLRLTKKYNNTVRKAKSDSLPLISVVDGASHDMTVKPKLRKVHAHAS